MAATGEGTAGGALPTLGIVGVTGAVGRVVLDVLPTRHSHWSAVRLAAGDEDVGTTLRVGGEDVVIEALTPEFFDGLDVAIFDIPPSIARHWVELAAARGVVAIDNSTEFRIEPDVPLVVPEVNPRRVADRPRGIIANPGATVMTMIDALAVLHGVYELTGLVVTTLQAASGLGRTGMTRLHDELDVVHGHRELGTRPGDVRRLIEHELGESPFPAPLALNVVPFVGHHVGDGWTSEEVKVRDETRKILDLPDLPISATCVRVPVVSSHSVTVHATFAQRVQRGRRPPGPRRGAGGRAARRPRRAGVPDPQRRRRRRSALRRAAAPGPGVAPHPRPVHLRRQPAQGGGAQHGADRRAGVARAVRTLSRDRMVAA